MLQEAMGGHSAEKGGGGREEKEHSTLQISDPRVEAMAVVSQVMNHATKCLYVLVSAGLFITKDVSPLLCIGPPLFRF